MAYIPVSRWMLEKAEAWGRMGRVTRGNRKSYLWRLIKDKEGFPMATRPPILSEADFYAFDKRLIEVCNPLELEVMRRYFVEKKGFNLISKITGQPAAFLREVCFSLLRRLEQEENPPG